ncbi:hypothetical protein BGX31_008717 [Mortierella sp. GBA43]|nr:hypothetical protein BGX31_008717 [Mortierella sp. GBA43]
MPRCVAHTNLKWTGEAQLNIAYRQLAEPLKNGCWTKLNRTLMARQVLQSANKKQREPGARLEPLENFDLSLITRLSTLNLSCSTWDAHTQPTFTVILYTTCGEARAKR